MFPSLFSSRDSAKDSKNSTKTPGLFAQMKKAVGTAAEVIANVSGRVATALGLTLSGAATMDAQAQAIAQIKAPMPTQSCLDLPRREMPAKDFFAPKVPKKQPSIADNIHETPSAKAKSGNSVGHFVSKNFKSKEWEGRLVGTDGSRVINDRKDLKAGKTYFYAPSAQEGSTFSAFLKEHPIAPKEKIQAPKVAKKTVAANPIKKPNIIDAQEMAKKNAQIEAKIQAQKDAEAKRLAILAAEKKQAAEKAEARRLEEQRRLDELRKSQQEMRRLQAEKIEKKRQEEVANRKKAEEDRKTRLEMRRIEAEKAAEARRVAAVERKRQLEERLAAKRQAEEERKRLILEKAEAKRRADAEKKSQEALQERAQKKPKTLSTSAAKEAMILQKIGALGHDFDINRFVESIFFNESRHTYNISNAHKAKQLDIDSSKVAYGAGQFTRETLRGFGIITEEQLADFQTNPKLQRTVMRKFTLGNAAWMVEEPSIVALLKSGVQPHEILAAMHHMGSEWVARVARRSMDFSNPSMAFYRNLKTSVDWLWTRTDLYVKLISMRYSNASLHIEKPAVIEKNQTKKRARLDVSTAQGGSSEISVDSDRTTTGYEKASEVKNALVLGREKPGKISRLDPNAALKPLPETLRIPDIETTRLDPNAALKPLPVTPALPLELVDPNEDVTEKIIPLIPLNRQNQAAFERLSTTAGISRSVLESVTNTLQESDMDELLVANMEHRTEGALRGNIEDLQILAKLHEIKNAEKKIQTRFQIEDIIDAGLWNDERSLMDELEDDRSIAELLAA